MEYVLSCRLRTRGNNIGKEFGVHLEFEGGTKEEMLEEMIQNIKPKLRKAMRGN